MSADRTRETALWGWLEKHLKELKPLRYDVQRIENLLAKGTPDVEGCIQGDSFWCELKVAHEMARGNWRIRITQPQVNRAIKRSRAGGLSWVLVRVCGPTWRDNRHYLIPGDLADQLLEPVTETRLQELSAAEPKMAAVELWKTMVGRVG